MFSSYEFIFLNIRSSSSYVYLIYVVLLFHIFLFVFYLNKHFIAAILNEEYECIFNMYKNIYIMYVMSNEDPRFNKFSSNNYDTISISVCISRINGWMGARNNRIVIDAILLIYLSNSIILIHFQSYGFMYYCKFNRQLFEIFWHVSQPITNHPWTIYVCQNQTYDVIA